MPLQEKTSEIIMFIFLQPHSSCLPFFWWCAYPSAPLGPRASSASLPQQWVSGLQLAIGVFPTSSLLRKAKNSFGAIFICFFNTPLCLALSSFAYSSTLHPILLYVMPFMYFTYFLFVLFCYPQTSFAQLPGLHCFS